MYHRGAQPRRPPTRHRRGRRSDGTRVRRTEYEDAFLRTISARSTRRRTSKDHGARSPSSASEKTGSVMSLTSANFDTSSTTPRTRCRSSYYSANVAGVRQRRRRTRGRTLRRGRSDASVDRRAVRCRSRRSAAPTVRSPRSNPPVPVSVEVEPVSAVVPSPPALAEERPYGSVADGGSSATDAGSSDKSCTVAAVSPPS